MAMIQNNETTQQCPEDLKERVSSYRYDLKVDQAIAHFINKNETHENDDHHQDDHDFINRVRNLY